MYVGGESYTDPPTEKPSDRQVVPKQCAPGLSTGRPSVETRQVIYSLLLLLFVPEERLGCPRTDTHLLDDHPGRDDGQSAPVPVISFAVCHDQFLRARVDDPPDSYAGSGDGFCRILTDPSRVAQNIEPADNI